VVVGFTTSVDFPTLNALQAQASFIPGRFFGDTHTPNAFVARIAASRPGVLNVTNVPFRPAEAVPFTGVVAAFTDTDTSLATDYTAVIDWGDGSTSLGVVTSASVRGGSFVVSGTHTYAEEGPYPVTVTVHDADGSIASGSGTTFGQTVGGAVTYRVSVDTSALAGASGFLAFQLNPGAPVAQPLSALVANFNSPGETVASATSVGDASGSLAGAVQLTNSAILNELRQRFTFGSSLTFDVRLEGNALSQPFRGAFGSTFSLTLLAADGVTPLQTADPSGAVLRITLAPDGGTRFISDSGDGVPVARAAAVNTVNVADAPLEAVLVPFRAVEGIPFTGTVASFTCANPASPASDFTATILWGDGSAASEGTIVSDGGGRFHVIGSHTYIDAGDYPLRVVVRSKGGSAALALAAPETAPIDGLQAPRVVAGGLVTGFVAADFNGDGKTDLAVWRRVAPTSGDEALYVLLGNGDGSFQDGQPLTSPAPGPGLGQVPIVAADFNGDGRTDLAAAETVFLSNGDGTFQAGIPFDAGPFAGVSFATADLDGDARLDLIALNGASQPGTGTSAQVLLGNGDGSFAPRVDYGFAPGFAGSTLDLVVADDFTSDGKTDLVINLFFGGHILLFRNNGDGTFAAAELLTSNFTLGTTADVDLDGHLDLVGTDTSHVRLLFGNGDGSFTRVVRYEAGDRPDRAILSDLDGDGIPELIVATRGGVPGLPVVVSSGSGMSILKGNADGSFADSAFFAATVFEQLALAPGAIQAADFNGDGNIDIALGHGANISIFFGRGDASVVVAPLSFSGAPLARALEVADFNGDGQADVVLAGLGAAVLLGNGDGTFLVPDSFQTSRGLTLLTGDVNGDGIPDIINGNWLRLGRGDGGYHSPAISLGIGGAFPVAQADLDDDGKLDLVTVEFSSFTQQTTVRVLSGNGDGTFTVASSFAVNEPVYAATVADFNRDGSLDLVVGQDTALTVLLGSGDGSFGTSSRYAVPNNFQFRGVATGDFNADGNSDLAGAAFGGVSILLGSGDGTFAEPVNYATGPFAHGLGVGDFNGDGVTDLVAPDRNNRTVSLLLGNGDGSFRAGVTFSTGSIASSGVVAGDLTGDGKLDFVIEDRTGFSGIMLFPGNGDGTFAPPLVYAVGEGLFPSLDGGFLRALAALDVDNDGRLDLLVTDSSGIVSVFLAQPGGGLAASRIYLVDRGTTQALASDLNRDGRPDLIVVHGGSASFNITAHVHIFLNRGDGAFQPSGDYDLQSFTIVTAAVGDFDGDGITDVVVDVPPDLTLSFNQRRALLRGNGDGTFVAPQFTVVPSFLFPQKLLADDVNGDGKLDLVGLAQIFQGGQVEVALGNGDGTFQSPIPTGPLPGIDLSGAAGRVAGFAAADFTGDGRLDLVVGTTDRSARVLPGNGDGTFGTPIESPMGARSLAFATGDIDGDGKTDLVAVNADATVGLLLGNGDGAFRRPIIYLSNGPFNSGYDVAVADVNGDGRPDVIAGASNLLTVFPSAAAPAENVANAPLAATGFNHRATQGAPFLGIVARFIDANPFEVESDFTATITWGDGQTSAGTVRSDGEGGFLVLGSSAYAQTGTYNVTTLIVDEDGGTATAGGVVTVETGPDASLTAVGLPVAASARVLFTGAVATFTDADPLGVANDFLAMVDWGDGQTSLGRVQPRPGGGFEVLATNTYAEPGNYTVAVSIVDTGGSTAATVATAVVVPNTDPPLTATGLVFHATEQTTFTGVVATFTDADAAGQVGDYTARIEWGDGQTSTGIVVADPAGGFFVTGAHGYREAGTYPVVVHITDEGGAADTAHSTGVVADAPLNALGRLITATEGAAFTGVIASFTDANPFSTADEFTATIAWGDGNISTGTITADPLIPGRFEITGANTYAAKGLITIDVAILAQDGATATARSLADVADAPLSASGVNVQTAPNVEFTAVVAHFTDQNPTATAAEFSATITWGDGTITPGLVAADAGGRFIVTGTHSYDATATYIFRVSILNLDGVSVAVTANATVTGASPRTTVAAIAATEGIRFVGLVASFASASPNALLGDFVATIDWGDGQTSAATVLMEPATGRFHVVGETTYAEQGQYPVIIAIADSSGIIATLSTTAAVADAPVVAVPTAAGTFTQAVARVAFSAVVATIDDNGAGGLPSDFTAAITWEDGHVSSGLVTLDPTIAGRFRVLGSTAYAQAGTYPVAVILMRQDGFTLTVGSTVEVAPAPDAAPFAVLAIPVFAEQAKPVTAVIATFRDDNLAATASDFSADIAWGDGAASAGQVILDPNRAGQFLVIGTHVYADAGTFPLEVAIREDAGAPITAETTALVTPAHVANSQPLARRDAYTIGEDKRLIRGRAAGVLANDADADGDKLTARVVRQPSFGRLTLSGNGSFRYTPAPNFNGRDSFDYVVSDGQVDSTVATVVIKVRPALDPVVLRQRTFFVPGMPGEKTVVRFDWLSRDARFNNEVALVRVDDAQGRIDGKLPGAAGYLQAALVRGRWQRVFPSGAGAGASRELALKAGERFMVFIVQNATVEMLGGGKSPGRDKSRPPAFFMNPDANPFGFDHVRLSRLDNGYRLAWEDLLLGGDRDFNDVVITVRTLTQLRRV
jgi:PKD repeat protein